MINSSYVSTNLIWGCQWDATMMWFNKYEDTKYYVTDSTGKANHIGYDYRIPTGSNEAYKVKNIYDMAGNVYEWTMETYSSGSRTQRGGFYNSEQGSTYLCPASERMSRTTENYSDTRADIYGSRITLYIE